MTKWATNGEIATEDSQRAKDIKTAAEMRAALLRRLDLNRNEIAETRERLLTASEGEINGVVFLAMMDAIAISISDIPEHRHHRDATVEAFGGFFAELLQCRLDEDIANEEVH